MEHVTSGFRHARLPNLSSSASSSMPKPELEFFITASIPVAVTNSQGTESEQYAQHQINLTTEFYPTSQLSDLY